MELARAVEMEKGLPSLSAWTPFGFVVSIFQSTFLTIIFMLINIHVIGYDDRGGGG